MYLNITPRAGDRKYLSIVHGYRDENGKVKKKTIKSLGYLDELEKTYDDPITYFKSMAREMDEKRRLEDSVYSFSVSRQEKISGNVNSVKNFGYAALSSVYHELGIDKFLKNKQRHFTEDFNANIIMQLIAYVKLLSPSHCDNAYDNRSLLFERSNYSLEEFYRGLLFLYKYKEDLQLWIDDEIKKNYNRDDSLIYYNITNHCSPTHVIKLGVFMDNNGVPISYELFPCNSNYSAAHHPDFPRIKRMFNINKVISVTDKPINNEDNIWNIINTPTNDGYIFNMAIHGADKELKQYILDEKDYRWVNDEYKVKSRIYTRPIQITAPDGRMINKIIEEKQIIFYSAKYAKRAKGSALDGYHALATSECKEDDERLIDIYRGLWQSECFFKLTKEKLETRPMCISVHDYIEIHLLTCFVSFVLAKILQIKTDCIYDVEEILRSLSRANCMHIHENLYLFSYYDEILQLIGEKTGIVFDNKIMPLGEIKKILGDIKKQYHTK